MDCGYGVLVKGVEEKMVCPKKRTVFGGNMNEEEIVELAVCGLHMRGFALEHQLTGLGAVYDRTDHTAPVYRMVRTATEPEKPMLVCTQNGTELEVEVWRIGRAGSDQLCRSGGGRGRSYGHIPLWRLAVLCAGNTEIVIKT